MLRVILTNLCCQLNGVALLDILRLDRYVGCELFVCLLMLHLCNFSRTRCDCRDERNLEIVIHGSVLFDDICRQPIHILEGDDLASGICGHDTAQDIFRAREC